MKIIITCLTLYATLNAEYLQERHNDELGIINLSQIEKELFITAIKDNKKDKIKLYLKNNEDLCFFDKAGNSPIFHAVNTNNIQLVKWLINHGSDLNIQNNNNKTALHVAVQKNNIQIVEILLSYNTISIYVEDSFGNTPLDYAELNNFIEIKLFINYYKNLQFTPADSLDEFIKNFKKKPINEI